MKKIILLLLIGLTYSSICCTKLEDPNAVINDEILQITAIKSTLLANNTDTTHIIARIPKDAGRLDITFTTTRGTFKLAAAKTIKQIADSISGNYRFATTVLKSDSTKGDCFITAETGSERNHLSLIFN